MQKQRRELGEALNINPDLGHFSDSEFQLKPVRGREPKSKNPELITLSVYPQNNPGEAHLNSGSVRLTNAVGKILQLNKAVGKAKTIDERSKFLNNADHDF